MAGQAAIDQVETRHEFARLTVSSHVAEYAAFIIGPADPVSYSA